MLQLYLRVGKGDLVWRRRMVNEHTYRDIAPSEYQICVGISYHHSFSLKGTVHKAFWKKNGWYMGSWFVKTPKTLNMSRSGFVSLITKINNTIKKKYTVNDENCPIFEGTTYSNIYPHLVKCIEEIIKMFKNETGNKDWSYYDGLGGVTVKKRLKNADNFIKNADNL